MNASAAAIIYHHLLFYHYPGLGNALDTDEVMAIIRAIHP